jgi:hypothetical protein
MWRRAGARLGAAMRRARNYSSEAFGAPGSSGRKIMLAVGGGTGAIGLSYMIAALGAPNKDSELLKKSNSASAHDDDPEAFENAGTIHFKTIYLLIV